MPEETPEQKAAREASEVAEKATIDRITAGVTAGVSAAIPRIAESLKPATPAVAAPRLETQLVRPSEEEIIEAISSGNKAEGARLMRLRDQYDAAVREREMGTFRSAGSAALGSLARQAAERFPHYKRFKAEIDKRVDEFCASTGQVPTLDMFESAHKIAIGDHYEELQSELREETLRKAREPEEPLLPEGRRNVTQEPAEPTSLQEALAGDWNREFRPKKNAVHGRSDDEELRAAGFRGGLKEFVKTRKDMEALEEETNGSFGLDRDWDKKTGTWIQ